MICYEVWVNGERACVAGAKNMKSLHASLIFPKQTSQALFMVGAETEPTESLKESANWIGRELNINDEIKIKIIESDTPDKPESIKSFGTKIGSKGEKLVYCSFCGQSEKEVERIVAGFQANVCSECFRLLADIFNEKA